jgi:hypothetical protein
MRLIGICFFFASTIISVGNGEDTPFWEAKWLNGASPRDLAPNLFRMTRFKRRSSKELRNSNWIRNLFDINTSALIEEFTLLFMALTPVQLSDQRDKIVWKWTLDGKFTVALAYDCQFKGSFSPFQTMPVWKATAETKCNFFSWLALNDRVLTADNMLKRNCHCNTFCSFCLCAQESTEHLLTRCSFTEAAWNLVAQHFYLLGFNSLNSPGGIDHRYQTL